MHFRVVVLRPQLLWLKILIMLSLFKALVLRFSKCLLNELINEKKEMRKKLRKSNDQHLKTKFYQLANSVRASIKEYNERKWNHLLDKFGPHPVSTSPFWSIINRAKNPKQKPTIPTHVKASLSPSQKRKRLNCLNPFWERLSRTLGPMESLIKISN